MGFAVTYVDPVVTAAAAITADVKKSLPHAATVFCSTLFLIRGGCASEISDISVAIYVCANIFRKRGIKINRKLVI